MDECKHDKQLITELKSVLSALLDVYEGEWCGFSSSAAGLKQRKAAREAERRAWQLLEETDGQTKS